MNHLDKMGNRSTLSCPDCGGVMWEIENGDLVRFRCHVGHAYTAEVMGLAMDDSLRYALASAQRGYEERVALLERMHERATGQGHPHLAETWRQKAAEYRAEADIILDAIKRLDRLATEPEQD
jgi:two-component system chemotaxis response regulator CheB